MTAPTLTEFLLSRIAEDEAFVEAGWLEDAPFDRVRVLAKCEANRRIVESYRWYQENAGRGTASIDALLLAERHAKWLALPYADHPDYRDEWKP